MYLHYFEQIVAATVAQLGGPADWALPYWNYSDPNNANARRIPPAFRAARTPDGANNPLRITQRVSGANSGSQIADEFDVDITACLSEPAFSGQGAGGSSGFGGPRTVFNHGGGPVGSLEATPHGSMHVAVGGPAGWMSRFNTAALDPLFWLHHANIDRLWVVWRGRDPQHVDPTAAQWLTQVSFAFHDAQKNVVSLKANQVVSTTTALLGYRYEDESDPLAGAPEAVAAAARSAAMERERIPEMVGATDKPITLSGQPETASLAVTPPTGPGLEAAAATPQRVYLNIENITGEGAPTSYAVYLNLPPGADPRRHRDHFAGVLPMFGVAEASETDRDHAGSGLHYSLEVGNVVRALQEKNAWDPKDVRVTFVPRHRGRTPASGLEAASANPIQVGRVSVYYA
jgi:tyrosinase